MTIVINGSTGITDVDGSEVLSTTDYTTISGIVDRDNRIINGDFSVWQRGTSFTTGVYGADRWLTSGTGANISQSQQAFTLGDTLGVNSPTYFLRQATSGQTLSTQYAVTTQRIESVRSYAGETVTVLGWARRSSGAGNMSIDADQVFGTAGTPSPNVLGISQNTVTLTESWTPFAAVISLPSIADKTLGTNNNDYLGINFWISAGSVYDTRTNSLGLQTIDVDLWGIHIKRGIYTADVTNLYRQRDPGTELALCQRYYETGTSTLLATYSGSNFGGGISHVFYNTTKRSVPSVTAIRTGGVGGTGTFNVASTTPTSCAIWFNGQATTGSYMTYNYYADAEI